MQNAGSSKIDIFISRKSQDAQLGARLYDYFRSRGLSVFESDRYLKIKGNTNYGEEIDHALSTTMNFLVVASNAEYFSARWIKWECRFFLNRMLNQGHTGKFFVVTTPNVQLEDIPDTLRMFHVIPFDGYDYEEIWSYLSTKEQEPAIQKLRKKILFRKFVRRLILITAGLLFGLLAFWFIQSRQPFNTTVFIRPHPQQPLHPDYPKFTGGRLTLFIGDKDDPRDVGADGQVEFKQIPAGYRGRTVPIKFISKNWTVTTNSIKLNSSVHLQLVQDGSLANLTGTVLGKGLKPLDNAKITVGTGDTMVYTNSNGFFNITLPYRLQRDSYILYIDRAGYKREQKTYHPKSQYIDIPLTPE